MCEGREQKVESKVESELELAHDELSFILLVNKRISQKGNEPKTDKDHLLSG
jgi:hypothetical protein